MPTYVVLLNYTDQGIKSIKDSPQRAANARKAIEAAGGKMHAIYLTMGQHDLVAIVEAPSDEAFATVMLGLASKGNVRSTTMRAFSEKEMASIIGKIP